MFKRKKSLATDFPRKDKLETAMVVGEPAPSAVPPALVFGTYFVVLMLSIIFGLFVLWMSGYFTVEKSFN